MIDFHTHLLPNMDDGSASVEETKLLLDELTAQGVKKAILTPHFYPLADTINNFFKKREVSLSLLKSVYEQGVHPELYLGAEVAFYHGISKSDELRKLCVEGTDLLLLELPFCHWDEDLVEEVLSFAENLQITVVLAHINRYLPYKNAKYLDRMWQNGVVLQLNAECFLDKKTFKKGIKLLKSGKISCLGSDAHNSLTRPPRLKEAIVAIEKKIGYYNLEQIKVRSKQLLSGATKI